MAKNKLNTSSKISKNPLSQALGAFFRKERDLMRVNSNHIAKEIGIGASFYRMIEAGTANLHPSKVLRAINAFPNSEIEFDALCKYLIAIQMVEVNLHSFNELQETISELSATDESFYRLFKIFGNVWEAIKEESPDIIKAAIDQENIYNELRDFLSNKFYNFEPDKGLNFTELNNIINETPSFYLEFATNNLKNDLANLQKLPTAIIPQELWSWENQNKSKISKLYTVVNNHKSVTGKQNLSRYDYDFLWENSFQELFIIFVDINNNNIDVSGIYNEFKGNLKEVLENKEAAERLEDFDEIMQKVNFQVAKTDDTRLIKLLQREGHTRAFDALWVYILNNGINIGFITSIEVEKELIKPGVNLNYIETSESIELLRDFWSEFGK